MLIWVLYVLADWINANGTVWTTVPDNYEAAYESQFCGRTDLSHVDYALKPAKSTLNRRPHGYPNRLAVRSTVGAGGFEPPTSRTRTVRSIRAEPRPELLAALYCMLN